MEELKKEVEEEIEKVMKTEGQNPSTEFDYCEYLGYVKALNWILDKINLQIQK